MLRYKLRTLLIVLALGPPVLAGAWLGYSDNMAVIGWLALIFFAFFVSLGDAWYHSPRRKD